MRNISLIKNYIILILFLSLFTIIPIQSQDTIYYDKQGNKSPKELAHEFKVVSYPKQRGIEATERIYSGTGQIKTETSYSNYKEKVLAGLKTSWNENGNIRNQINYLKGKWHGDYISYWSNGNTKRKDHYKQGEYKKGKVWDSTGVEVKYYPLIERAEFPGGPEALGNFLKATINNPESKKGRITVKFVIDKTGQVIKTEIMKSDLPELNEEALRVVASMPRWMPGKQDGEPASIFYALPLVFQ